VCVLERVEIDLNTRRDVFGEKTLYCERHGCTNLSSFGREMMWMLRRRMSQSKGSLSEKRSAEKRFKKAEFNLLFAVSTY
jgi:hypothetical protein